MKTEISSISIVFMATFYSFFVQCIHADKPSRFKRRRCPATSLREAFRRFGGPWLAGGGIDFLGTLWSLLDPSRVFFATKTDSAPAWRRVSRSVVEASPTDTPARLGSPATTDPALRILRRTTHFAIWQRTLGGGSAPLPACLPVRRPAGPSPACGPAFPPSRRHSR